MASQLYEIFYQKNIAIIFNARANEGFLAVAACHNDKIFCV